MIISTCNWHGLLSWVSLRFSHSTIRWSSWLFVLCSLIVNQFRFLWLLLLHLTVFLIWQEIYSIKLPGNPKLGEGKPENQNHAIIFTRGNAVQTIDMNQVTTFFTVLCMWLDFSQMYWFDTFSCCLILSPIFFCPLPRPFSIMWVINFWMVSLCCLSWLLNICTFLLEGFQFADPVCLLLSITLF